MALTMIKEHYLKCKSVDTRIIETSKYFSNFTGRTSIMNLSFENNYKIVNIESLN